MAVKSHNTGYQRRNNIYANSRVTSNGVSSMGSVDRATEWALRRQLGNLYTSLFQNAINSLCKHSQAILIYKIGQLSKLRYYYYYYTTLAEFEVLGLYYTQTIKI